MAFVPNLRNVRLFKNTGFDKDNPPAMPSLLTQFNYVDVPAINALQMARLTSVCIKATEDQVENADYCYISDGTQYFYYAVIDYHMEKPDTCTLFIDMAYILSAGGITSTSWDIIDGITERHHISDADDILFAYTEEDPLLVPSEPLEIVIDDAIGDTPTTQATNTDSVVIEASYDVYKLGTATPAATAYTTNNSESVIVPDIPELPSIGYAEMYDPEINSDTITKNPAICYYDGEDSDIRQGLARARSLGIESGILNQYILPGFYGTATPEQTHKTCFAKGKHDDVVLVNPDMQWQYGTGIHNKRVYAGKANSYGLICTASGNSVEFLPEDIHTSGSSSLLPTVTWTADPRPNGRPYFRYKNYKGSSTNFWMNCISGLPWQSAPLVYTNKSGSEIDTVKFQTELSMMELNATLQTEAMKGKMYSEAVGQGLNIAMKAGLTRDGDRRSGPGLVSQAAGMAFDQVSGAINDYYTLKNMQDKLFADEAQRAQDFYISQRVVAPSIHFPRSESLRDFKGNCVVPYRFRYTQKDAEKIDKLLTMYGYRITEPLTKSMLNVRSKFNYVKSGNVSIGGNLPKWFREGIARELISGKRFWKVPVDTALYTNGGNT